MGNSIYSWSIRSTGNHPDLWLASEGVAEPLTCETRRHLQVDRTELIPWWCGWGDHTLELVSESDPHKPFQNHK